LEVLSVLAAEHYREVLDLRATLTLVDARKVHEERYTNHPTFNQQLAIADVIVANKADQYHSRDFPALLDFLEHSVNLDSKSIFQVRQGMLNSDWLTAPASPHHHAHHHHTGQDAISIPETPEIPEVGYLNIDNEGEGFYSRGWIFKSEWIFDARELYSLLLGVNAERIKGVFITDQGITAYNKADNVLTEAELDDSMDSRIECISSNRLSLETLEDALLACVLTR
jgi:G3E family GTPase